MTFIDTEGISQGRKPRELYAVEFKFTDTEGKRVTSTLCFQRKSSRDKAIASWERWRSERFGDDSVCVPFRATLSWEKEELLTA